MFCGVTKVHIDFSYILAKSDHGTSCAVITSYLTANRFINFTTVLEHKSNKNFLKKQAQMYNNTYSNCTHAQNKSFKNDDLFRGEWNEYFSILSNILKFLP
jgi:hypothetical protein